MRVIRVVHQTAGLVEILHTTGDQLIARQMERIAYGPGYDHRLTRQGIVVSHIDTDSDFEDEFFNRRGVR